MDDLECELYDLIKCLAEDRINNNAEFRDLLACLFNVTSGKPLGFDLILYVNNIRTKAFPEDHLKLQWKHLHAIGQKNTLPFNLESLHGWAQSDNEELYETLSNREQLAQAFLFQSHE